MKSRPAQPEQRPHSSEDAAQTNINKYSYFQGRAAAEAGVACHLRGAQSWVEDLSGHQGCYATLPLAPFLLLPFSEPTEPCTSFWKDHLALTGIV